MLFDQADSRFKNSKLKDEVWKSIRKEINGEKSMYQRENWSVVEIKAEWGKILRRYRDERKKFEVRDGLDDVIRPDWPLYPMKAFLDGIKPPRTTVGNVDEDSTCMRR